MAKSEKDLVRALKTVKDELARVNESAYDGRAYKRGLTAGAY